MENIGVFTLDRKFSGWVGYFWVISVIALVSYGVSVETQKIYSLYTVRDLYFGFGNVISNLLDRGLYVGEGAVWKTGQFTDQYSHRFPLIPWIYYSLAHLTEDYLFASVFKNLTCWIISFWTLNRLSGFSPSRFLVMFFLIALITNNGLMALDYEEAYAAFFILWMIIGLEKKNFPLYLLAFGLMLLLKSAYWLPSTLIMLGVVFLKRFSLQQNIIMVVIYVMFSAGWASWTYSKSGFVATPWNASTYDGFNLLKGVNDITLQVYPEFSQDTVDHLVVEKYGNPALETEASINKHYKVEAMEIIMNDPVAQIRRVLKQVIFIGTHVYWARENKALRNASEETLVLVVAAEKAKIPSGMFLKLYTFIILFFAYSAFLLAFYYKYRKSEMLLFAVPFIFCWANLLIFCNPRHLYLLTVPFCYWALCYLNDRRHTVGSNEATGTSATLPAYW